MLKKLYVTILIPFLFSNLLCSIPTHFNSQDFENLDVNKPETLAQVAQMLNLEETLLANDGLFNPKVGEQVNGSSGHYVVSELRNTEHHSNKEDSIKAVLGSSKSGNVNNKTVYTYQYDKYQAKENYPEVSGNFDGVKDNSTNQIHIKGGVQIKLPDGTKTLHLYLGDDRNSGNPDSVVIDSSHKASSGKISLSFGSVRKEYDLSSLEEGEKAMINQLGLLNVQ